MSKKFILFIVEGLNDKREIEAVLHSPWFDPYKERYVPYFYTKHGDLTTAVGVTAKNIQQKMNDIVLDFRRNGVPFSNIKVQDIQEIVQIVDMDGVFIPYENIIRSDRSTFEYTDTGIITSNVDGARGRNKKKAEILLKLVEIKQIGNIPYSVYFASCNMDHLLFNKRMLSQFEKASQAMDFQVLCQNNPDILNDSIFKEGIAADCGYYDSWDNIQLDCQSLLRHTNLNLFFSNAAKNAK